MSLDLGGAGKIHRVLGVIPSVLIAFVPQKLGVCLPGSTSRPSHSDLVEPGLVRVEEWHPEHGESAARKSITWSAAGRKPQGSGQVVYAVGSSMSGRRASVRARLR